MKTPVYRPGEQVRLADGITGVVIRIIWDGDCWSYECLWWHEAEPRSKEFQINEIGVL